jgi:hypothetical protein
MNAFEDVLKRMEEQEAEAEKQFLDRFGSLSGTLRRILDKSDLEALRTAGIGFIINIRPERSLVHRAACEAVGVMSAKHPKIFSGTRQEAADWLANDRVGRWDHCADCRHDPD